MYAATDLQCMPDVGFVLDWRCSSAVEEETLEAGLGVDPTTAANLLVYRRQSLEDGYQAAGREVGAGRQVRKLDDADEEVVEEEQ